MRGFTLVEMLIVLSILLILFAIVGTISSGTLPKNQLATQTGMIQETLRRAQAFTIAGKHDVQWGVHIDGETMTLFGGESYATRTVEYDQTHFFPSGMTLGGLTDVIFTAPLGQTADTGVITLIVDATSESSTISINAQGLASK